MRLWIPLLFIVATLAGCSSAPQRPEWVDGSAESKYPVNRYLVGTGQGDSAALARDRARADLVKVFETRIVEQSEDVSEAAQTWSGGNTAVQQAESSIRRVLTTSSEHAVEGIRIAEAWADDTGRHHALAVLERGPASIRLRARIDELDQASDRLVAAAGAEADPLRRIGLASAAVANQRERSVYQRYLRVLDPAGVGLPPGHGLGRLIQDRERLAARIRFAVRADGADADAVERLLTAALVDGGYRLATLAEADYLLVGQADLNETGAEGWQWARGVVRVDLYDRQATLRRSAQWPVKAAASDGRTARRRALSEAADAVRGGLAALLFGADSAGANSGTR